MSPALWHYGFWHTATLPQIPTGSLANTSTAQVPSRWSIEGAQEPSSPENQAPGYHAPQHVAGQQMNAGDHGSELD